MAMNNTIKALREQNNYSQSAVAQFLGISRQMYIKYENGDAAPPVKIVVELSNFYRVPYDVILEDKLKDLVIVLKALYFFVYTNPSPKFFYTNL